MKRFFIILALAIGAWILLRPSSSRAVSPNQFSNAPSITMTSFWWLLEFRGGTNYTNFQVSGERLSNFINSVSGTYVTNQCYVTANQNTNVVVVSGAGTTSANGNYTNGGGGLYLKNSSTNAIRFDGVDWLLTNNAGATLYSLSLDQPTNLPAAWTIVSGAAPAPLTMYDSVTNCFSVMASSVGLAQPAISTNLYVDAATGNDTNAIRGRMDRPWRNVQPALLATHPGDTVIVGPGIYPTNVAYGGNFLVSNRVSLVGAGRGVTILGTHHIEGLYLGSESVVCGLTHKGVISVGSLAISTNSLIEACEINGTADAIYVFAFENALTINNCRLTADYDGLADWENRPGGSNRVIRITGGTTITVTNGQAGIVHGITGGDNRIEMFGGSIEAYNGQADNQCVNLDVDTLRTNKTGSVLLSNVRLRHSSTNGLSMVISNGQNLPIFLDNCTDEPVIATFVNGSFTNQFWMRDIRIPSNTVRTNRLVDPRQLTNSLMQVTEQGFTVRITDDGYSAAATNILIYPGAAGQTIGGAPFTNITAAGGSMTLQIRSNNWQVISKLP